MERKHQESETARRVPFWRSLQTKYALTYLVIVAAVVVLLNTTAATMTR